MNVPIVEDYAAIAKRLADLDRTHSSFRLPPGIHIHLPGASRGVARCRLCFMLDDFRHRLYFAPELSDHRLDSEEGLRFVDFLARHFPTLCVVSSMELRISSEDSRSIKEYLRRQP